MAKYTGKSLTVDFAGSAWNANAVKMVDTKETIAVAASTGCGDTDETYLATIRDTEVTIDMWDDTVVATIWNKVEPTGVAGTLNIFPQGGGTPKLTGSAIVTDRQRGVSFNGVTPIQVTLKVSGGLTES